MIEFLAFVWKCIYFFAPAYFANMAPVIFQKVPFLKYPIDFGKEIQGKRILGDNKTFRGIILGTLLAVLVAFIQHMIYENGVGQQFALVDYSQWIFIGFMLGFGALVGDLLKSMIKRRLSIQPGSRFFPFDQVDFVMGGLLFVSIVVPLSWSIIVTLLFVSVVLHIITNHIAYYTGIRNEKW